MIHLFPPAFTELGAWALQRSLPITEARQRFAQMVILTSIAETAALRDAFVFKGGNALDFVWLPNRSTIDLDFSLDADRLVFDLTPSSLDASLTNALATVQPRFGVTLQLHGTRQHPPGLDRSFALLEVRIGYALPDEPRIRLRMSQGRRSTQVIPVEISLNDSICATTTVPLGPDGKTIRIATLEDIVAEKLRALLQQPLRNRQRSQDVLDLAIILRDQSEIDPAHVGPFLEEKCRVRHVRATKEAFHHPIIAEYARSEYDALQSTVRRPIPAFNDAFARILLFVNQLPISER